MHVLGMEFIKGFEWRNGFRRGAATGFAAGIAFCGLVALVLWGLG